VSRPAERRSLNNTLIALCITVIVSYGVVYYAFAVLLPRISADTGWSRSAVTAAFSAGNLTGGLVGIVVGRTLQKRGPRPVMTSASVLGALAMGGVAWSPNYSTFFACWVLAGVASAGLFYPPAFAALTGWFGEGRVRAITTLTLAAGFASTIFAPLAQALVDTLSWRQTYGVLAVVLGLITVPAHFLGLDHPWPAGRPYDKAQHGDRQILTSRTFVLATSSATLMSIASYASIVGLVPLLTGRGLSPTWAAWALGLGGAGQVAGRVLYPFMTRVADARARTVSVIVALAAALAGLALVRGPTLALVLLAVAAGAARGLFTLVEATLVSDYWGPERYATISGVFNAPILAASAAAPWLGVLVADATGSSTALFLILVATALVAALLAAAVQRPTAPP
jgi:MFS family permease